MNESTSSLHFRELIGPFSYSELVTFMFQLHARDMTLLINERTNERHTEPLVTTVNLIYY